MSYTIFYKSMFTKLSDGRFIPMIELGDNNVFVTKYDSRGRKHEMRSREWWNFRIENDALFVDEKTMLNLLDNWNERVEEKRKARTNGDEEMSFGWFEGVAVYGKETYGTTYRDVLNLFKRGIKLAVPFEYAVKILNLSLMYYPEKGGYCGAEVVNFSTEDEMLEKVKEIEDEGYKPYFYYRGFQLENYYKLKSVERKFIKNNKGNENFIIEVTEYDLSKKYVKVEDGCFAKTDDADEAFIFKTDKVGNNNIGNILHYLFDGYMELNTINKN